MDPLDKNFLEKLGESWLDLCIFTYGNMLQIAEKMTELGKTHHEILKKEVNKDKSGS